MFYPTKHRRSYGNLLRWKRKAMHYAHYIASDRALDRAYARLSCMFWLSYTGQTDRPIRASVNAYSCSSCPVRHNCPLSEIYI